MAHPEFGHAADVDSIERNFSVEEFELTDGYTKTPFMLKLVDSYSVTAPYKNKFGIAAASKAVNKLGGVTIANPVSSVSYTKEEEVGGMRTLPTDKYAVAGGAAALESDLLTYVDNMLWIRVKYTLRIEGLGKPPSGFETTLKRGTSFAPATGIVICAADGTTKIVDTSSTAGGDDVTMIVKNLFLGEVNDDWNKWSIELVGYKPTTTNGASSFLLSELTFFGDDPDFGKDIEDNYTYYKITTEDKGSQDTMFVRTESVECYARVTSGNDEAFTEFGTTIPANQDPK